MILDYIQILVALLLLWPRGYVLIYLIDRSKGMSFGFKFFAGWVLGFAGFTLDVFVAHVIGGQNLTLTTFLMSSITQIFGFGFLVFLAERKILYPKFNNLFKFWKNKINEIYTLKPIAKVLLILLFLSIIVQVSYGLTGFNEATNESSIQAQSIIDKGFIVTSGSGNLATPLNDAVLKLWLLKAIGSTNDEYSNLISIFYYLIFVAVFYNALSKKYDPSIRIFFTLIFSALPFIYWSFYVSSDDILFALILFLTIACIFNFLTTKKLSFFYLSLMYLAFSLWTKNIGFITLLPLMIFFSISFLVGKKIKIIDFIMAWFWAIVTVAGWIYFLIRNRLNIFDFNFDILSPDTIVIINITLAPILILFLAFYLQKIFGKINT